MEMTCPDGRRSHALDPPMPARDSRERERELVDLVREAQAGDETAWSRLVERFEAPLRRIARSYRLGPADIDDVLQVTWMRLFTGIRRLENPAAVGAWLATTARRECLRVLKRPIHEQLSDDPLLGDGSEAESPEGRLVAAELRTTLADAMAVLPERHRRLMVMLAVDPSAGYRRIGDVLTMPTGSIGPIRQRCLSRLAADPRLQELRAAWN